MRGIWWVHEPEKLSSLQVAEIRKNETGTIGVNAISCWEVAKLVEYNRLELPIVVDEWIEQALCYPAVKLFALTPEIAIESTRLPGDFHRDPADQIIVATARIHNCPLITSDGKILRYSFVKSIG